MRAYKIRAMPTDGVLYTLGYRDDKNFCVKPLRKKETLEGAMALIKKLDAYKRSAQKAYSRYEGKKLEKALERIKQNSISAVGFAPYGDNAQNYVALIDNNTGDMWYHHGAGGERVWYWVDR